MNAYNDDEYIEWCNEWNELIFSKCNFNKTEDVKRLDNGYYIYTYTVKGKLESNKNVEEEGSISRLYNERAELVYEWKSTYHESRVSDIIHHSNHKDYLIFTEDLYGYSVLELDTLKSVHYVPKISFYKNKNFHETFIWMDFHYNDENNYLAIDGCIWASPYSLIVVDFSNPLEIQEEDKWIDIHNIIDSTFDKYSDIDFKKWDGDNLHCIAENSCTEKQEDITISLDKLNRYISKDTLD